MSEPHRREERTGRPCAPSAAECAGVPSLTVLARRRLSIASLTRAVSASTLSSDGRREGEEGEEGVEAGGTARSTEVVRSRRRRGS